MLVLFDHSTPSPFASHLTGHPVTEARECGWDRLSNGELLAEACQLKQNSLNKNVILLTGLPGCGKTTHLCQMCQEGWLIFDDFKANAFDNSSAFRKSRKFRCLIIALRDNLKCAVADIDFCKTESREEAESVLFAEVPTVRLGWLFFENDPRACEANIRSRSRSSLATDLEKLREYSDLYLIPLGADVLPIVGHPRNGLNPTT
jgi:hypothetical protein